jgi:hypothetical protein
MLELDFEKKLLINNFFSFGLMTGISTVFLVLLLVVK